MQNAIFAPGADPEEMAVRHRMLLAQQLRQQGAEAPQGQMVSGRYVGPSWTQGLANVLKSYSGAKGEEQAMQDYQALGDKRKAKDAADVQAYVEALRGKAGQTIQPTVPNDDAGNAMPIAQAPATPGDPNQALAIALASRNPLLQQVGAAQMKESIPKNVVVGRSLVNNQSGAVVGTDATWKEEQQAGREAKAAEIQAKLEDARLGREERAALQRELAQMRLDGQRELRQLGASMRPAQTPSPLAMR
jgi:hypothetical protein